jgi:UPF0271 protein
VLTIDLNCDMGEGMKTDARIFPFISSANISCGFHAGDKDTMRRTVELALHHGVAIGAHPSYPDKERFGRVDMLEPAGGHRGSGSGTIRYAELEDLVREQLEIMRAVCVEFGTRMHHVKLHGALYNRAARDLEASELVCRAIFEFDAGLLLYGLSGSLMKEAAGETGLRFVSEVFADRSYRPDGSLTPRNEPGALIEDLDEAVGQALRMIREGRVLTGSGAVDIVAETICLHGDGSHAVEYARQIAEALASEGVSMEAPAI